MELRVSRASAVVVQRVPPALVDWFMEWQRGITAAAEQCPGYRDTNVHAPTDDQRDEWVVVIHFADEKSLREWLDSPTRVQWVQKLRSQVGDFELKALPGGFGPWFAGLGRDAEHTPSWKFALTVLLALFPTVMLLALFPWPYTIQLGYPFAILIGNILSCSILQWAVTPALTKLLGPWLKANAPSQWAISYGGAVAILLVLLGLATVCRLLKIGEP